jgi:hypothetical protein
MALDQQMMSRTYSEMTAQHEKRGIHVFEVFPQDLPEPGVPRQRLGSRVTPGDGIAQRSE